MKPIIALIITGFLAGCTAEPPPRRFAWITGLKPEKTAYYKDLHAKPWPAINRKLKECNIRNYSIHLKEIDGKLYLFSYLEYAG
ncbi:MAG: hypothetical protein H6Q30_447, partial [Bacteroidetes bacterium]|nr:hypothetical protein [Bacteroidota bacterium]